MTRHGFVLIWAGRGRSWILPHHVRSGIPLDLAQDPMLVDGDDVAHAVNAEATGRFR
jgi:hypothetical protein